MSTREPIVNAARTVGRADLDLNSEIDSPLEPGTSVGEFVVEAEIGRGGFGRVYRVHHPLIGKRAAIKVLSDEVGSSQNAVARFIQEARAVNEIQHPNIIDIFSFGQLPDKRHYFVMELLEGQPLDTFLNNRDPVSIPELIAILDPVAQALDTAHAKGIIHRDLKPENIFLCFRGGRLEKIKLLDFGIAKLARTTPKASASPKTQTGATIGTPAFMSPEQCLSEAVSAATDVYALGVICHLALTGDPPFRAASTITLLALHINTQPPAMSSVNSAVPTKADAVVLRMLEKKPTDRYPSAGEAMVALASAARESGISLEGVAAATIVEQPARARTHLRNPATVSTRLGPPLVTNLSAEGNAKSSRILVALSAMLVTIAIGITAYNFRVQKSIQPVTSPTDQVSLGSPSPLTSGEPIITTPSGSAPRSGTSWAETVRDAGYARYVPTPPPPTSSSSVRVEVSAAPPPPPSGPRSTSPVPRPPPSL